MSWGKGWEVGVRKAIWAQQKARERAAEILATEQVDNPRALEQFELGKAYYVDFTPA